MEENILIIDDTKYETKILPKFQNRKAWTEPNPKEINAFIPGTVLEIFVKPGDIVRAGEKLLILEAMKMKNTLKSPIDGKVKKIHAKIGERVPKSTLLIELD
jgi:biotin carboxyl carrier protein